MALALRQVALQCDPNTPWRPRGKTVAG